MIINKLTKAISTHKDFPNDNWTINDCYIIDDNSELGQTILRYYPNIEFVFNGNQIIDVKIANPMSVQFTHEEINALVVEKIREKYNINEEFKMINLGIVDATNPDYLAYRHYVQECVNFGNALESKKGGDNE